MLKMITKKHKCSECNNDAVIIENETYYCGSCYVDIFNAKAIIFPLLLLILNLGIY